MTGPDGDAAGPPDGTGDQTVHRETGLELARSIARSLAGGAGGRKPGRQRRRGAPAAPPQASGSHPDDRDPQLLDTALGRLVADQGWGADVRVHAVIARWDLIVGPQVAQHVRPVSYDRGELDGKPRLVVQTDSTAWATQMRLLAATVVRRLNQELGDGTVAVIDVRGPAAPSWKHGRRSLRDGRGPRDTYG